MSFGDHLEELRKRLILAVAAPIPLAILALPFADTLIELLLLPLTRALAANGLPEQVQALSPPEVVLTQIKLSLLVAAIISAPWMLWQAWLFISPGLYRQERRFANLLMPGSALLTVAGVLLLYYFMLPVMLNVMVKIGANVQLQPASVAIDEPLRQALDMHQPILMLSEAPAQPAPGQKWIIWPQTYRAFIAVQEADGRIQSRSLPATIASAIAQQYRLSEYVNFVLVLALGTVIGFQTPLVVMLMGWIGVASPEWFRKNRKYALFICGLAAAIITPSSDLISMLVMMLPLYGLYELGIVLLVLAPASRVAEGRVLPLPRWRWGRSDKPASASDEAAPPSQPARTVARTQSAPQEPLPQTDQPEDRP